MRLDVVDLVGAQRGAAQGLLDHVLDAPGAGRLGREPLAAVADRHAADHRVHRLRRGAGAPQRPQQQRACALAAHEASAVVGEAARAALLAEQAVLRHGLLLQLVRRQDVDRHHQRLLALLRFDAADRAVHGGVGAGAERVDDLAGPVQVELEGQQVGQQRGQKLLAMFVAEHRLGAHEHAGLARQVAAAEAAAVQRLADRAQQGALLPPHAGKARPIDPQHLELDGDVLIGDVAVEGAGAGHLAELGLAVALLDVGPQRLGSLGAGEDAAEGDDGDAIVAGGGGRGQRGSRGLRGEQGQRGQRGQRGNSEPRGLDRSSRRARGRLSQLCRLRSASRPAWPGGLDRRGQPAHRRMVEDRRARQLDAEVIVYLLGQLCAHDRIEAVVGERVIAVQLLHRQLDRRRHQRAQLVHHRSRERGASDGDGRRDRRRARRCGRRGRRRRGGRRHLAGGPPSRHSLVHAIAASHQDLLLVGVAAGGDAELRESVLVEEPGPRLGRQPRAAGQAQRLVLVAPPAVEEPEGQGGKQLRPGDLVEQEHAASLEQRLHHREAALDVARRVHHVGGDDDVAAAEQVLEPAGAGLQIEQLRLQVRRDLPVRLGVPQEAPGHVGVEILHHLRVIAEQLEHHRAGAAGAGAHLENAELLAGGQRRRRRSDAARHRPRQQPVVAIGLRVAGVQPADQTQVAAGKQHVRRRALVAQHRRQRRQARDQQAGVRGQLRVARQVKGELSLRIEAQRRVARRGRQRGRIAGAQPADLPEMAHQLLQQALVAGVDAERGAPLRRRGAARQHLGEAQLEQRSQQAAPRQLLELLLGLGPRHRHRASGERRGDQPGLLERRVPAARRIEPGQAGRAAQELHRGHLRDAGGEHGLQGRHAFSHGDAVDAERAHALLDGAAGHRADLAPVAPVDGVEGEAAAGLRLARQAVGVGASGGVVRLPRRVELGLHRAVEAEEVERLGGAGAQQVAARQRLGVERLREIVGRQVLQQGVLEDQRRVEDAMDLGVVPLDLLPRRLHLAPLGGVASEVQRRRASGGQPRQLGFDLGVARAPPDPHHLGAVALHQVLGGGDAEPAGSADDDEHAAAAQPALLERRQLDAAQGALQEATAAQRHAAAGERRGSQHLQQLRFRQRLLREIDPPQLPARALLGQRADHAGDAGPSALDDVGGQHRLVLHREEGERQRALSVQPTPALEQREDLQLRKRLGRAIGRAIGGTLGRADAHMNLAPPRRQILPQRGQARDRVAQALQPVGQRQRQRLGAKRDHHVVSG